MKRISALICAICLTAASLHITALADNNAAAQAEADKGGYSAYIKKSNEYGFAESGVYADCSSPVLSGNCAEYTVNIAKDGLYNLVVTYSPKSVGGSDLKFGLQIDGKYPFEEAESLELPRFWRDKGDIRTDEYGNQQAPEQEEITDESAVTVYDPDGVSVQPLMFALSEGTHKVKVIYGTGNLNIKRFAFAAPDAVKDYKEVRGAYSDKNAAVSDEIIIEAEKPVRKNAVSLVAKSDNNSPKVTPADSALDLCNIIGGSSWKTPNETITWEFNAPSDGLYKIGMVCKQDLNMNFYSYRTLKIDGKIPFSECSALKFGYDVDWQTEILSDDSGEPYLFYLTAGKHEISLSVTLGDLSEIYSKLNSVCNELGNLYLDITMITGESPDQNRDYELHKQIPDFIDTLSAIDNSLSKITKSLNGITGGKTNSLIAAVNNMSRVVSSMKKNYYNAPKYLSDYYNNYSTVSSWLYDMKSMPLSLDQIRICPSNKEFSFKKVNFGQKIVFTAKRFISSFSGDYNAEEKKTNNKTVNLWVNWGRDQSMALNTLIKERFTAETGINVNLKITAASLTKGILSGNTPDVSLQLSRTEPVNLALRGALYDLTRFSDYDDVISRFGDSAELPYTYKNGVYALPDTQSFYLMFYRSDILAKLGIAVPETWDDFLAAVGVLQINNMNAYIPYTQITDASTVNAGVGGLNMFASVLQQFGGDMYNKEQNECLLNSALSYKAFKYWTEMYTRFKLPTTASFYNRFRAGTMPLGIEVYTTYTTLAEAAPEIKGRWGIALVPGVKTDDGKINHTVAGAGTGCAILSACKDKDSAWEFLKWWTSAETQTAYNNSVESVLGTVSRIATANTEAFSKMSWEGSDVEILTEQRKNIKEIPEVPGSYYVSRSVDQAFWNVVDSGKRPKDMLEKWSAIANSEIKRKIKEYEK